MPKMEAQKLPILPLKQLEFALTKNGCVSSDDELRHRFAASVSSRYAESGLQGKSVSINPAAQSPQAARSEEFCVILTQNNPETAIDRFSIHANSSKNGMLHAFQ